MNGTNTFAPAKKEKGFSGIINAKGTREMIEKSVGDPARAAALVSTLISTVNASDQLRKCEAGSIISAALRGEIGMGLSLAMGQYSIVPYGTKATFQIGAKGLKQLAIRSGKYAAMGFFDVRQGEYKGRDPMTREPRFEWIEDEEQRLELPIIGYYGFYKLNKENSNFFQCIYWSHEQILKHADRYSKAFDKETYEKLLRGQMPAAEAQKLRNGSPWYDLPDSMPHQKMCMKTIAIQLLNDGMAPLEVQQAINADTIQEASGTPVTYDADVFSGQVVAEAVPVTEDDAPEAAGNQQNGAQQDSGKSYAEEVKAEQQPSGGSEAREQADAAAVNSFFDEA